MTPELLEQLLHEDESVALDFKEGQYAFSGADAPQKSELLKDILGFVNAWRRAEAYILIGVREVRGARSEVVGIAADEHLDDHSLQQFVNSKTNQPVRFSYEAFSFEGEQIGIIRIDEQERPVWLTHDYGKLRKDKVYFRSGSSTDPNRPATLDEVTKMMQASKPQAATLEIQFADVESATAIGTSIQIKADFIEFPAEKEIPSLQSPRRNLPPKFSAMASFSQEVVNPDYYRKMAICAHHQCNFHPLRFVITNCGEVPAEDVRLEMETPVDSGIEILEESRIEARFPERSRPPWGITSPALEQMNFTRAKRFDGVVDVTSDSASIKIEVEYSKIQPGRQVSTDKLFVACKESGTVTFNGQVFSKNLPKPMPIELSIEFDISARQADLERFLEWADNPTNTEEE
jgi:hypothetical protein